MSDQFDWDFIYCELFDNCRDMFKYVERDSINGKQFLNDGQIKIRILLHHPNVQWSYSDSAFISR